MGLAWRTETAGGVTLVVSEFGNAIVAAAWDGPGPEWGATTVALPGSAASQVLGDRDTVLGRTLGGFLAKRTGKVAVVSTHLKRGGGDKIGPVLLELAARLTEEKKDG